MCTILGKGECHLFKRFISRHKYHPALLLEVQIYTLEQLGFSFTLGKECLLNSLLYQYSRHFYESEPYDFLLSMAGESHLDENYEDIRFSYDIWTLDLNSVCTSRDVGAMIYEMNLLSRGQFKIDHFEVTAAADQREAHITFDYHGIRFSWDFLFLFDRFDFGLLKRFGKLAKQAKTPKEYYYSIDGNLLTVIYRERETVRKLNTLLKNSFVLLS